MKKVIKTKLQKNLRDTILTALQPLGGIDNFINKGDVVLVKPNFNTADPFPASTDFNFLKEVVEIIYEKKPKLVIVGESSTMSLNTRKVMEKLGIFKLLESTQPPRIYVFEELKWIKKEISGARYLKSVSLTEILDRVDKIVLLPCLKTHKYGQFTGALKLAVGLMKPVERVKLHLSHLQEKIAELNVLFQPNLILMDARKCFINRGPAEGELKEPNLILASDDRVAIDVEGIKIIQSFRGNSLKKINAWDLPQIRRAVELAIGAQNPADYQVLE
ncbi:MAG: DUF362 domain-containing protein [Minisyncoccales bacterium]